MSHRQERKWVVHRKFEPNRLSQATLEQAYGNIVPPHIRVLCVPANGWQEPREVGQQPKERAVK